MKDGMFTPCSDWIEKLAATHTEDLSPSERAALDTHIASCPACSAVRTEYYIMSNFIRNLSASNSPPELSIQSLQLWENQGHRNSSYEEASSQQATPANSCSTVIPNLKESEIQTKLSDSVVEPSTKERGAWTLQAHIQCYDRFFEVFTNEVEYSELLLENVVSQLLLDFFDEVMVDTNIIFSPRTHMGLQHCSIQIHAQCEHQSDSSLPHLKENIELSLENNLCSILRELFGSVIVDSITFSSSPWEHKDDTAQSQTQFSLYHGSA